MLFFMQQVGAGSVCTPSALYLLSTERKHRKGDEVHLGHSGWAIRGMAGAWPVCELERLCAPRINKSCRINWGILFTSNQRVQGIILHLVRAFTLHCLEQRTWTELYDFWISEQLGLFVFFQDMSVCVLMQYKFKLKRLHYIWCYEAPRVKKKKIDVPKCSDFCRVQLFM